MLPLVFFCLILGFAVGLVSIPIVREFARSRGLVDQPDRNRKLQDHAVALGGGIGVFASLVVAIVITLFVDRQFCGGVLGKVDLRYYHLFIAAAAILGVGLADDLWTLRGRQKLLLQLVIVSALVTAGTKITHVGFFGIDFDLGIAAFPVTVLWLLVAVNALNLIDGADGMATTVGAIICVGLGWLSFERGGTMNAVACFALAGSLFAFLVFNKPPATIYLGDAGSMMIGLFVGVLSVWTQLKESTVLSSAPIAILAIPLFDSSAAILRRWLTGRSIYTTDRAHLHHLLQHRYGRTGMLFFVAMLSLVTTSLSVLSVYLNVPLLSAVGVLAVLLLLLVTKSFGIAEARLIAGRAAGFAKSMTVGPHRIELKSDNRPYRLQGVGNWDDVWEPLVSFAEKQGWAKIKIDVSMAWLHEGYHASYQMMRLPEKLEQISLSLPLFATLSSDGRRVMIGRLSMIAASHDQRACERLAMLGDYLRDLEPHLDRIVADIETTDSVGSVAAKDDERPVDGSANGGIPARAAPNAGSSTPIELNTTI